MALDICLSNSLDLLGDPYLQHLQEIMNLLLQSLENWCSAMRADLVHHDAFETLKMRVNEGIKFIMSQYNSTQHDQQMYTIKQMVTQSNLC